MESVTLGQLLVCGEMRLADGWETPSSSPLSLQPLLFHPPETGGLGAAFLLCLRRASGLEISFFCFRMDEGGLVS